MRVNALNLWLQVLVFGLWTGWFAGGLSCLAAASEDPASVQPSPPSTNLVDNLEGLVATLEDDSARQRLVDQLKLMLEARKESKEVPPSLMAQLLEMFSRQMAVVGDNFNRFVSNLRQVAAIDEWLGRQVADPERKELWKEVLTRMAAVIGAGFLLLYLSRLMLLKLHRSILGRTPANWVGHIGWLAGLAVVEALPVILFAVAMYGAMSLLPMRPVTRLVLLAWVNASILVRVILLAVRIVVVPGSAGLRVVSIGDEAAHYLEIWVRRLAMTSVYGFFALQTGLLLGLSRLTYEGCLRLLGLFVGFLIAVFILQNRATVADWIRGKEEQTHKLQGLRNRAAALWHWIALLYLLILYATWALAIPNGFFYVLRSTMLTLVVIAVGALILRGANRLWERGFKVSQELKTRYPNLEPRANRYLPAFQKLLRYLISLLVILFILQAWGLDFLQWFITPMGLSFVGTLIKVAAMIAGAFLIWEAAGLAIENYLAETNSHGKRRVRSARSRTLLGVARKALMITLTVLTSLMVLTAIGLDTTPLLATAGVLGLAVGFGSQKLVQDLITGVFILLEDLFAVGDVIKVGDTAGLVEAVSIRNVRLRDFSGTVHTIPYSSISTISNLTKDFSFYVFDVGVAYRENVDEVMAAMKEAGDELLQDPEIAPLVLDPLEVFGIDKFADSAVVIKARIKTLPIKQWTVGRAYNRLLKMKFDDRDIEIPFPHQTVYFGVDKEGSAPPVRIEVRPRDAGMTAIQSGDSQSESLPAESPGDTTPDGPRE